MSLDANGIVGARTWSATQNVGAGPWLILGKGPSFAKFDPALAGQFRIVALNHAVREVRCDLAVMMDLDVADACGESLATNAAFVAMPWRPHVSFKPSRATLPELTQARPVLQALARDGRLIAFNAESAREMPSLAGEPLTNVAFSCAEAALNLLADNGAKEVRTLGVDGGTTYADAFSDLDKKTLLANGRDSFSDQFKGFTQTLRRLPDLQFGPLGLETPVRIFIGADETQALGARLFEYSVRRFATISTRFEIIDNAGLPVPADPARRARTGFSFARLKIPALCGHAGRAIYVDADMQVFTDIRDLWTRTLDDAWLLYSETQEGGARVPQYSVMLLDCAKLQWDAPALVKALDDGTYDYKALMYDFAMMPAEKKQPRLEFEWNSLETYAEGRTKLIHYTDMHTQPWVSHKNKNGQVWYKELRRAVKDGFISVDEVHEAIARGHVSPLLPKWAKLAPYPNAGRAAKNWVPPYQRLLPQNA
jgi:hypothetical protein